MRGFLPQLLTPARLWVSALLCLVPLSLVWSITPSYLFPGPFKYCQSDPGAPFPYPPIYPYLCVPIDVVEPGSVIPGTQTPARVMLVFAALILVFAAVRWRTDFTKRLVRAATVLITIGAALAVADRVILPLVLLLAALVLVAPLVWSRVSDPSVPRQWRGRGRDQSHPADTRTRGPSGSW